MSPEQRARVARLFSGSPLAARCNPAALRPCTRLAMSAWMSPGIVILAGSRHRRASPMIRICDPTRASPRSSLTDPGQPMIWCVIPSPAGIGRPDAGRDGPGSGRSHVAGGDVTGTQLRPRAKLVAAVASSRRRAPCAKRQHHQSGGPRSATRSAFHRHRSRRRSRRRAVPTC